MKKAIFKYNSGEGALLCSKCAVIIKTGRDFTSLEHSACKSEAKLPAQYCVNCSIKKYKHKNQNFIKNVNTL
jgi:ferredoxin